MRVFRHLSTSSTILYEVFSSTQFRICANNGMFGERDSYRMLDSFLSRYTEELL